MSLVEALLGKVLKRQMKVLDFEQPQIWNLHGPFDFKVFTFFYSIQFNIESNNIQVVFAFKLLSGTYKSLTFVAT